MSTRGRILATLGLILSLAACNNVYSPTTNPTFSDVAGAWDVTFTVTGGSEFPAGSMLGGSWTLTVDSGTGAIGGTLTLASGGTGTITGTEAGHHFVLTTNETAPCTSGVFDTPDGNASTYFTQLTGTFDGSDCNGTLQTTFSAVRH